jgi:phage FluMu gp28-like protein
VTLQDALDQGLLWKLQTKFSASDPRLQMDETDYFNYQRRRAADEETFQQEYMCVPADDAGAFLSYDLIDAVALRGADDLVNHAPFLFSLPAGARCLVTPEWLAAGWSLRPGAEIYLGYDVARVGDLSVIWVWEKIAGIKLPRLIVEMKNVTFGAQEAVLDEIMKRLNVRRACLDASGLGRQLAERAQERHGLYRVEAITFTAAVKEELAYPFRSACEDKSLRLPGDPIVTSDLRKVRKETTGAGNVRFVAERGGDDIGHADRFWAGALGLHAAKASTSPFLFARVPGGLSHTPRAERFERTVIA